MLSHRSTGSGTAFVQDGRKAAFDPETRKDAGSLIIKPTTELSRLGMDRFIEKLRENEVKEMQKEDGFVDYISKPLAIVTPFVVAIAGKQRLACCRIYTFLYISTIVRLQRACLQID